MTLLVAGTCENEAWMVADMAIKGPTLDTRSRQYMVKIEQIQQTALIGFAGDPLVATRTIRAAAAKPLGTITVTYLLQEHLSHPQTDFMYAYVENGLPHLICITNGYATESTTAHIGMHEAFSEFQEIKLARTLNPVPDALELFVAETIGESIPPTQDTPKLFRELANATLAMQKLFYKSSERGVGGTAIPYYVSSSGARVFKYGYSVTDPGLNTLDPGSIIMHGTAQFGGYGVSVTELKERDGIVIYWLQLPGGTVWLKSDDWYQPHDFSGTPSVFKEAVKTSLGRNVDIWFENHPQSPPESLRVLKDHAGRPRLTMVQSGRSISFSWMQGSEDDFSISSPAIPIDEAAMIHGSDSSNDKITVKCGDDKLNATLTITTNADESDSIQLSTNELDKLINQLAQVRSEMLPEIKAELEEGTPLLTIIDPAWKTRPILHPDLPGHVIVLRHNGFGWLSFLLPPNEATALGKYLGENIKDI